MSTGKENGFSALKLACRMLSEVCMQALRVVMLLVTVLICYLLFFHSVGKVDSTASEALSPDATATGSPSTAHSQYKEAMDRAHAAAKSMQDERKEANSELGAVPGEK